MALAFDAGLNLRFLQIELAQIDLKIQREVRRWQLAGQDAADTFRGLYVSEAEVSALLNRPLGGSWGQMISLEADERQAFEQAEAELAQMSQQLVNQAQTEGERLRLVDLVEVFDLSRFELEALLICLAPSLDLRYERFYGYLQDDVTRKRPSVNLALNLLCPDGAGRLQALTQFTDQAPLFFHDLLTRIAETGQPLLNHTLAVDDTVVSWLLGDYQPQAALGASVSLAQPAETPEDSLLAEGGWQQVAHTLAKRPLLVFSGPDQNSQDAAARLIAARQGRSLLTVDLAELVQSDLSPQRALSLVLRDARLTGAIAHLRGWDACLVDDKVPVNLLSTLCYHPDLVIVCGEKGWQASGIERERHLLQLTFPVPEYKDRLALWQHLLSAVDGIDKEDIIALAGQYMMTSGQIRDSVAAAKDMAAQADRPLQNDDLYIAVRAHSNPRLATLARKIDPRYDWLDIILPQDQRTILQEIAATVRGRPLVLEEWGVGKKLASSKGVTVLFAGEPGTGKTMAAEIIAQELRLDLYKIDLSTMISKYIGETEKNLERIFNEATTSNAILFFDEADAIFGKRSEVKDAHDRYANIEVSYLLQRMEAYDGVTILATNLRANLDEAFTRRLQFAVDFPFPEKEDRLRIWQTLFPPGVPRDDNIDFSLFANRFKIAGGNIRNIIITAAYLAAADGQQVSMAHLLHGTRRELQKMGRLIGEEDLRL